MKRVKQHYAYKITKIKKVFDINKVINSPSDSKSISKYYKLNMIPYSLIYAGGNFIHMGLTENGILYDKKNDVLGQAKIINKYIKKDTNRVLELACGRGANSYYLAQKYPRVDFHGLDLPNGQIKYAKNLSKKLSNFKTFEADFHSLDKFSANYFDLIFIIEALCHSSNKLQVLKEANRILKPNEIFIIFDAFTNDIKLNKETLIIKQLIESGMAIPEFPFVSDIKRAINRAGFKIIIEKDFSNEIIPTLKRLEKYATIFFDLPIFIQKTIIKLFPSIFTYNIISGYLMRDSIEFELSKYLLFVLKKK